MIFTRREVPRLVFSALDESRTMIKRELVFRSIAGLIDSPIRQVTVDHQFPQRRFKLLHDSRDVRILTDVQDLAEVVVPLLETSVLSGGIEPDLKKWDKCFGDVIS